jgi:hypothetical protein
VVVDALPPVVVFFDDDTDDVGVLLPVAGGTNGSATSGTNSLALSSSVLRAA